MPWRFVDDGVTSDLTVLATGHDLDEVFASMADAVTTAMIEDPARTVAASVTLPAVVTAPAPDLLLVRFLDEILFYKDARGLVLRAEGVRVDGDATRGYTANATLVGEPIDPRKHVLGADVKAATLYGLRVDRKADGWEAEITLDV